MIDNELDIGDTEDMIENAPHRRSGDDWMVKHWPMILTLGAFFVAGVTMQLTSLSNSKQSSDNEITISSVESSVNKLTLVINDLKNKSSENKSKNLMTYNTVETVKTDLMPKLNKIDHNQTVMLTMMKSFSQIYPTKEFLADKLSKVVANFRVELDKKVGYDRIDKRHLKD